MTVETMAFGDESDRGLLRYQVKRAIIGSRSVRYHDVLGRL